MKKLSVFVVVVMMAVGAFAASNEVTSVNSVGFIRTVVEDGGYAYVSLPFVRIDGQATYSIFDIFPVADYPQGTVVSYFEDGEWKKETRIFQFPATDTWSPGTATFVRGDALFINTSANAGSGDLEVTIMGEVPADTESTIVLAGSGYTGMGYAYPADLELVDAAFNAFAEQGDVISWWDQVAKEWAKTTRIFQFPAGEKWDPEDVTLKAGQGYFYYNSGATIDWVEPKPYVWP
jgi:hypothetical protein